MSYRNDLEAARERRSALARELRTIEGKMDELEALEQRKKELQRELKKNRSTMERARSRVALPLLANVKVASPCNASWDEMTGDDRVRFCGQCEKNVYDLSAMAAEQAEALLRAHGESLCVRFYRRRDGTVLTRSDCPAGMRKKRKNRVAAAVLAGGLMTAGLGSLLWSSTVVMGGIKSMPPVDDAPAEVCKLSSEDDIPTTDPVPDEAEVQETEVQEPADPVQKRPVMGRFAPPKHYGQDRLLHPTSRQGDDDDER